jgi:hypothetical protein
VCCSHLDAHPCEHVDQRFDAPRHGRIDLLDEVLLFDARCADGRMWKMRFER